MGETEIVKRSGLTQSQINEKILELAPTLQKAIEGQYAPSSIRHNLFFGKASERKSLSQSAMYGDFGETQTAMMAEAIGDWCSGKLAGDKEASVSSGRSYSSDFH
jgi:hypothetical protein